MNDQVQVYDYYTLSEQERNRVMRNTYWLLALSMVPTVLGAWLGVSAGLGAIFNGGLGMILMLVGAFGFIYAIERTKESITGVYVLLGFTFFMGLVMSRLIGMVLGFRNGSELVMTAFGGTAGIFFLMASLSTVIKRDLGGMAKWLMVGVMVMILASIINIFTQSSALMLVISAMSMFIFSAFLLYDLKQVVDGGETNYISATLTIYLDLINIFQSLLAILGIVGGERD
jgi:modulator of FtsH protease